jgi:hypothetical protein
MSDLPAIGTPVHYVDRDGTCAPMHVHAHMTPTHLCLADVPWSTDPQDPRPGRTVFTCTPGAEEPGSWHLPC